MSRSQIRTPDLTTLQAIARPLGAARASVFVDVRGASDLRRWKFESLHLASLRGLDTRRVFDPSERLMYDNHSRIQVDVEPAETRSFTGPQTECQSRCHPCPKPMGF